MFPGSNLPHAKTLEFLRLLEQDLDSGVVLTDEELQRAVGLDPRPGGAGYGFLRTAMRKCDRESGTRWKRIPNAGCIKNLDPVELVAETDSLHRHFAKTAKRQTQRMATVDLETLPDAVRSAFLTKAAQIATLAMFASGKTGKMLEAREITTPIEPRRLLEALKAQ